MQEINDSRPHSGTQDRRSGQALIEYALILVLVAIAFGIALAATGPVIGNVFSNTVFNLLGGTPPGEGQPVTNPEEFWLTVTWVAANPPVDSRLPTRTPLPATITATAGPSPTASPVLSPTPRPASPTPSPTVTPLDVSSVAPWKDESNPYANTVADPERWRVSASYYLGSEDWCGDYFDNVTLSGTPGFQRCSAAYGQNLRSRLDFNWGALGPINNWPAANPFQNYSIRFKRTVWIDPVYTGQTQVGLTFNFVYDDGMRFLIYPKANPGSCPQAAATPTPGGAANAVVNATGCLVIDDWNDAPGSGPATISTARTLDAGVEYILQVDYYERAGNSQISMSVAIPPNPDDANTAGGAVDCNWGRRQTTDSIQTDGNLFFMWEEYVGGDFRQNMRCNLEYRGYVNIPAEAGVTWEFVFWDVWDLQGAGASQTAQLQIAEYVETAAGSREVNRGALNWQTIALRNSSTTNYNWTRNVINLSNLNGTDYAGKNVTFRFVMTNGTGTNTRRWYIDDVEIRRSVATREFRIGTGVGTPAAYTYTPGGPNSFWNLNTAEQAQDFIVSPGWKLNNFNTRGGIGSSWEHAPNVTYTRFSESPAPASSTNQMRVHFVEFNGWVDVSGSTADLDGDLGPAQLTFYQSYTLGRYTGLELQYSTTPYGVGPAAWQTVPAADPTAPAPAGRLRSSDDATNQTRPSLEETTISLAGIPVQRFRLRFAMTVRSDAELRDGWFIDDIYLEREGRPDFLDYPFFDDAEVGMDNWLVTGNWARTNVAAYANAHSFHDSPGTFTDGSQVPYQQNANAILRSRWPLDFYNDTPANLLLTTRNSAGGNTRVAPAVRPVMTFWHRRLLNQNDNLLVEWRKWDEPDTAWKSLWSYTYNMTTLRSITDGRWARNVTWEFVYIDLTPITRTFTDAASTTDDDVVFRFRLNSDNSNTQDDGIYLDAISINEFSEVTHRLWPSAESRNVAGVDYGAGTSATFFEDFDGPGRADNWRLNGQWRDISWEQSNGLYGLHDSVRGAPALGDGIQVAAPTTPITYNANRTVTITDAIPPTNQLAMVPHDSFSVLELIPIIDMRATNVSEEPTLYFWTRYDLGASDRIQVQISAEQTGTEAQMIANMNNWCRSTQLEQCYEHLRGWGEWTNTPFNISGGSSRNSSWAWTRQQIDLRPYASNGTNPGQRIRIRFVVDALDNATNQDGWYIDQVSIEPLRDGPLSGVSPIRDGGFSDNARNLNNWVTEGTWGLDPEVFFGSGGSAATLGLWREYFWNGPSSWGRTQADAFLDARRNAVTSDASRTVLDINYDIRRGSPRAGINSDRIAGRWVLDTPFIGTAGTQQGDYTLITISDDGVRAKYEEIDGAGNVIDTSPRVDGIQGEYPAGNQDAATETAEWNLIYNWNDHGRTADMGSANLQNGRRYRLTVEWYEGGSDAVIIVTLGGSNFSFTDSPKQGAGVAFPDVPAIPRANSSLIMDGTLDLFGIPNAVLQFRTFYEVSGNVRVEVSRDGGFTWSTTGFTAPIGTDTGFQGSSYNGTYPPGSNGNTWEVRRHNLSSFVDNFVMIRFRLDRQNETCLSRDNTCDYTRSNYNTNGRFESVWIADIRVAR